MFVQGPPGKGLRALTLLSSPLPGAGDRMKLLKNPIKQLLSLHKCDHGASTLVFSPHTVFPSTLKHVLESGLEIQAAISFYAK